MNKIINDKMKDIKISEEIELDEEEERKDICWYICFN